MKTCTECGTEKPRAEFYKRSDARGGLKSACKACCNARSVAWAVENPEKIKANAAAWVERNPEKAKENNRLSYIRNREKVNARSHLAYMRNREKVNTAAAEWARLHPEKKAAKESARRARKLQATPVWADKGFIDLWYTGAKTMTQLIGKPYHVDHVVPLKSKLVCGLHVPANMQILPGADNSAKGNRYWPDMP